MQTIWKYKLKIEDSQVLEIPEPANILSVGNQFDEICLWVEVDTTAKKKNVKIYIYGTGHPFTDTSNKTFLGTVSQREGRLIWHIFAAQ